MRPELGDLIAELFDYAYRLEVRFEFAIMVSIYGVRN